MKTTNGLRPYRAGRMFDDNHEGAPALEDARRFCGACGDRRADMINPAPSMGVPDDFCNSCWHRHCDANGLDHFTGKKRRHRVCRECGGTGRVLKYRIVQSAEGMAAMARNLDADNAFSYEKNCEVCNAG